MSILKYTTTKAAQAAVLIGLTLTPIIHKTINTTFDKNNTVLVGNSYYASDIHMDEAADTNRKSMRRKIIRVSKDRRGE